MDEELPVHDSYKARKIAITELKMVARELTDFRGDTQSGRAVEDAAARLEVLENAFHALKATHYIEPNSTPPTCRCGRAEFDCEVILLVRTIEGQPMS